MQSKKLDHKYYTLNDGPKKKRKYLDATTIASAMAIGLRYVRGWQKKGLVNWADSLNVGHSVVYEVEALIDFVKYTDLDKFEKAVAEKIKWLRKNGDLDGFRYIA